jgi:hypothetical protein
MRQVFALPPMLVGRVGSKIAYTQDQPSHQQQHHARVASGERLGVQKLGFLTLFVIGDWNC